MLAMRGAVVDSQRTPVSERVAVLIPTQQTAIEPNEAIKSRLLLKGIKPEASRADVRMEVTEVIFDWPTCGRKLARVAATRGGSCHREKNLGGK